jgi:hypothetical protein
MSASIKAQLISVLRDHLYREASDHLEVNAYLLAQFADKSNSSYTLKKVPNLLQKEVNKALQILKRIEIQSEKDFTGWNLTKAKYHLEKISDAETLKSRQHNSGHQQKVALADFLYTLWTTRTGTPPPSYWAGEADAFSKFLADVLVVINPDWTPRSVIETYLRYMDE